MLPCANAAPDEGDTAGIIFDTACKIPGILSQGKIMPESIIVGIVRPISQINISIKPITPGTKLYDEFIAGYTFHNFIFKRPPIRAMASFFLFS